MPESFSMDTIAHMSTSHTITTKNLFKEGDGGQGGRGVRKWDGNVTSKFMPTTTSDRIYRHDRGTLKSSIYDAAEVRFLHQKGKDTKAWQ